MCGRFSLFTAERILKALLGLASMPPLPPRYNIAPSQMIMAVRHDEVNNSREAVMVRWGLIPSWAKDPSMGNKMINARSETVFEKPAFREAARKRRCLIPASGFFEWKKFGNQKQPYFISRSDGEPMVFAGLWESWKAESSPIESCTILTADAMGNMREIHERTPVILEPEAFDLWLREPESERVKKLLKPYDGELRIQAVNKRVNNVRNDDPGLVEEVMELEEQGELF